jgi:hypothetical protein
VEVAGQVSPLAVLEVLGRDGGNDAGSRMPGQCDLFVEGELEELVAQRVLLVIRQTGPVPCDKLPSLDGSQLAKPRRGVPAKNLKEGIERRRRAVVALVERGSGGLDTLRVGWC